MGAYLSQPITTKVSSTDENEFIRVSSSSMQGWRVSQEDDHNALLDFDQNVALFAVYDGHGGHEVAAYTAKKLPSFIRANESYAQGNLEEALIESFVDFDKTLIERSVVSELKNIASSNNDQEDDEDEREEVENLYQEATMPLEQVIAKYGETDQEVATGDSAAVGISKTVAIKPVESASSSFVANPTIAGLTSASSRKPVSPFLKAKVVPVATDEVDSSKKQQLEFPSENELARKKEVTTDENTEQQSSGDCVDAKNTIKNEEVTTASDVEVKSEEKKPEVTLQLPPPAKCSSGKAVTELQCNKIGANGSEDTHDSRITTNGHDDQELVNGNGAKESSPPLDGTLDDMSQEPCVKGKGKGKGKKSSVVKKSQNHDGEEETAAQLQIPVQKKKLSSSKTGEELYRNILIGDEFEDLEEDDDSDDQDDEAIFESDNDDSDEVAIQEEDSEEDSEEDEEDTENEEGESDGSRNIGGEFNEEPGNDSGCTAVVALLRGCQLYVANAGDSRCIVCRDGKAVEMSFDHKPEDKPEHERIEKAGGRVTPDGRVNGGLNLSRAIGDHAYKTNKTIPLTQQMISPLPDIKTLTINAQTDSFIFLACDGIWNSLSSQEVVDFINKGLERQTEEDPADIKDDPSTQKLTSVCEELFDHCLAPDTMGDGTGCDNMTAVLVKIRPSFTGIVNKTSKQPSVSPVAGSSASSSTAKKRCTPEDSSSVSPPGLTVMTKKPKLDLDIIDVKVEENEPKKCIQEETGTVVIKHKDSTS